MITHSTKNLLSRFAFFFSHKNSLINAPPEDYVIQRPILKENGWRFPDLNTSKSFETHLSNAEALIKKVPVVYSHDSVVRCLGGTEIGAGHPQVYIQLNTKTPGVPVSCKWCGIRYALKHHH